MGVVVREANEDDVPAIRGIFEAVYGPDYPYQQFLDARWLLRSVFADDIIMLVAVDGDELLGTASFVFDLGAHSDLLGEFGRLVVHPSARGRGIGGTLMRARQSLSKRAYLNSSGNDFDAVCIKDVFAVKNDVKHCYVARCLLGKKLAINQTVRLNGRSRCAKQGFCAPVANVDTCIW